MRLLTRTLLFLLVLTSFASAEESADNYPMTLLEQGKLTRAHEGISKQLAASPDNHVYTFELGLVQAFEGVQRYSSRMYALGLNPNPIGGEIPFLRFPVALNPAPQKATNQDVRAALEQLQGDLLATQTTLSKIPDDWNGKVGLALGRIRIDLNGDGDVSTQEELWRVLQELNPQLGLQEETARGFELQFDAGDARWLEGYCHLMAGVIDFILAYDSQQLWNHSGHIFFSAAQTPFPYLIQNGDSRWYSSENISDIIAFVHLINLPLIAPERMQSALHHFEETITLSRRSWKCILAEKDNDKEWLPAPGQASALGWTVSKEMLDSWFLFLDEADDVLAGRKLLPFWREPSGGMGVNLRKVFIQPTPFDLVLWVQGPGAQPYLEKGPIVSRDIWQLLQSAFGGNFFGFAVWFN